jgi:predicted dehydrogenase
VDVMMQGSRPIGFVVVGAGYLGAQRAAAVSAARGVQLVAVHDRLETVSEAVARRHKVEHATDYAAALARTDVDAVIISTPHADHFGQVLAALEAGKHVLCEKPLAVRPEEARCLALRADELRLRLATGLNHRFYPPVADALDLVASWAVGRVESVRAEIGHKANASFLASWHTDVARSGGGTLMDNGPHACDLIRRFLGEIVAAKGYCRRCPSLPHDCESEAYALFKDFAQGFAELRASWNLPAGYLTLDVRGSDGWLRVETAPWRLSGLLSDGRGVNRTYPLDRVAERLFRLRFGCERSLVREIEAFVSARGAHPRPEATAWDGCRVTEMIDAVYRSDATGEEIAIRPLLAHLPWRARRRAALEDRAA